jgi:hypothetical protein
MRRREHPESFVVQDAGGQALAASTEAASAVTMTATGVPDADSENRNQERPMEEITRNACCNKDRQEADRERQGRIHRHHASFSSDVQSPDAGKWFKESPQPRLTVAATR